MMMKLLRVKSKVDKLIVSHSLGATNFFYVEMRITMHCSGNNDYDDDDARERGK